MKLLTIQSLACYGKCSSTIALPVLSAMGIETTLLPTSLLSTHTGFADFTFQDLTEQMKAAADHWQSLSLHFDAIYVGYLGSQTQLDFVLSFLAQQPQARLIVDPVMGDNGALYSRITPAYIAAYQSLCCCADLILPNLTEACALLGYAYDPSLPPERLLTELRAQGAKNVVITGLAGEKETLGAMCLCEDGSHHSVFKPRISGHYHGTGDLFASVCCGALLRGSPLPHALTLAADFTALCIQNTQPFFSEDGQNHWHGLRFETALPWLIERM
ncbi:MAG: pyridoxamine kinase [Lachnospiraceae bacterium]|jgi:pyridoxine kinase|nr:pyridoxamine kinase [Lachnospiraceae bacterium]